MNTSGRQFATIMSPEYCNGIGMISLSDVAPRNQTSIIAGFRQCALFGDVRYTAPTPLTLLHLTTCPEGFITRADVKKKTFQN